MDPLDQCHWQLGGARQEHPCGVLSAGDYIGGGFHGRRFSVHFLIESPNPLDVWPRDCFAGDFTSERQSGV